MLLLGSTLLKHGRHFDYWNLPMNMRMYVCYLDLSLFWKINAYTKNGLGNAQPALCSRLINILFYSSDRPTIFEYIS
jgi:uncharacterized membrane protein